MHYSAGLQEVSAELFTSQGTDSSRRSSRRPSATLLNNPTRELFSGMATIAKNEGRRKLERIYTVNANAELRERQGHREESLYKRLHRLGATKSELILDPFICILILVNALFIGFSLDIPEDQSGSSEM